MSDRQTYPWGRIWGMYNHRDSNGQIIPWTRKSAAELFQTTFDAMGRYCYDVDLDGIEDLVLPANWVGIEPQKALLNLCEMSGRKAIFDEDGCIRVVRKERMEA